MLSLPLEIIYQIFSFLQPRDLTKVNLTCKFFCSITKDDPLLRKKFSLALYEEKNVFLVNEKITTRCLRPSNMQGHFQTPDIKSKMFIESNYSDFLKSNNLKIFKTLDDAKIYIEKYWENIRETKKHLFNFNNPNLAYLTVYKVQFKPDFFLINISNIVIDKLKDEKINYLKMERAFAFIEYPTLKSVQYFKLNQTSLSSDTENEIQFNENNEVSQQSLTNDI